MKRIVLDANVFASGGLRFHPPRSTPGEILHRWQNGSFELVVSDFLMAEIERTLDSPYFAERVSVAVRDRIVTNLDKTAIRTAITVIVSGIASHREDDLVLATALSGAADYLVTGDKQLLKLGFYQGVHHHQPEGVPLPARTVGQ